MITYEYWRHANSGETYAVQLEDDEIIGICGPLHYDEVDDPSEHDFEAEDVDWANHQLWR